MRKGLVIGNLDVVNTWMLHLREQHSDEPCVSKFDNKFTYPSDELCW